MLCSWILMAALINPWADQVVSFNPGSGGSPGYDDPLTCLGPPERFSGEAGGMPGVVTPFAPAWGLDELVSLGQGGSIVLAFDTPVTDDPLNPFGIDLIIFGNTGLLDGSYPEGLCSGFFGADGGQVEVSPDRVNWTLLNIEADAPWPTIGWIDSGPYDTAPGTHPADPVRPVDPAVKASSMIGQPHEAIIDLYGGSAGGTGVDLGAVGLDAISFVRISVDDAAFLAPELDALVDVGRWGDATGDHLVDVNDLLTVVSAWGQTGGLLADRTFDGVVDVADLLTVLDCWN
ncbi:MAG: hypothetical protein MK101_09415 [Phycisphaerales bacterium]|nr:hypothetical protein [Phycisphaerales bacterium]